MTIGRVEYDVAIIGAGTAGLSAERSARRAGARTLLIDPAFSGTTCATVGCMPSKLLIAAARSAQAVRDAGAFGIEATLGIDGRRILTRLRHERDHFAETTRREIDNLPFGVSTKAMVRFAGPNMLQLDDGRDVHARSIVIATGSRPSVPDAFDPVAERVLTNETIFELETLPASLAVVGAGPLGLELAQALGRLGVRVTLLDKAEGIGGARSDVIASRLKTILACEINVHLGVEIAARLTGDEAELRWTGASTGGGRFERVLIAAGRRPALSGLDLAKSGLKLDEHGVPIFNRETLQCGESAVFIAGDAGADRPVLHEASSEGAIAGTNAAHYPDIRPGRRYIPFSIMFTDPPLATIGRTNGARTVTGEADYQDQGRARVDDRAAGIARLHADVGDGRLVGAEILCPDADHLSHLIAWSIEGGQTAASLLDRPFYHPTTEEGLKPALRSICDKVGAEPPSTRDEGAPSGG